ncbi:MAG: protein kinase [Pseudomonadota bacterium]
MTQVDGGGGVPEGTKLNDMYEVGTRIAMGGMGEVYTGKQIQTGQKVAIKMILPEHANNELILELFRKEANTLHDVYHEAIVRYFVFSVDPTLNRPYMAMEFAGGPALGDRLSEKGPLDEREMTVLRKRIAGGLHAAHKKGVVHRDISSDNIILVNDTVEDAKIIDFGIAKSSSSEGTLIGSGFAGKLNYVSPEQLGLAGGEVTAKSDIYSLGLVFAEAAIGKPLPMGGSHVDVTEKRKVVPDLSEVPLHVRPLIEWMLQPDPVDRPSDLEAVASWDGAAPADNSATIVTGAGAAAVHPRDRLKQAQQDKDTKKGGTPWALIGLGGAAVAAAAVGAVMFLGGDQGDVTTGGAAGGSLIQGDTSTNLAGSLTAPVQAAQAPSATTGESYDWSTPAFSYAGDPSALSITPRGSLPAGLTFMANNDGSARISGVPTVDGTYSIGVVAISPEEDRANISVQLTVDPAPVVTHTLFQYAKFKAQGQSRHSSAISLTLPGLACFSCSA